MPADVRIEAYLSHGGAKGVVVRLCPTRLSGSLSGASTIKLQSSQPRLTSPDFLRGTSGLPEPKVRLGAPTAGRQLLVAVGSTTSDDERGQQQP